MRTRPRAKGVRPDPGWLRHQSARLGSAVGRRVSSAGAALTAGVAALAGRVAYHRQEVVVVALLAASLLGGAGVDTWRRRDPGTLVRLEAEPPRLAPPTRGAVRRDLVPRHSEARGSSPRRFACPKCRRGPGRHLAPPTAPAPTAETPLDLNRATTTDLVRLPGIGPRLARRILQHRETLGGRFHAADDLAAVPGLGPRRAARLSSFVTATPSPDAPDSPGETAPPREPP